MEKLVIQTDVDDLLPLDNFIEAVCDVYHLDNYSATMAVPVVRAVECVLSECKNNSVKTDVVLSSDFCREGIYFAVESQCEIFQGITEGDAFSLLSQNESFFMIRTLADKVRVSEDGKLLKMIFAVRGISKREILSRISTLQKFYAPYLAETV